MFDAHGRIVLWHGDKQNKCSSKNVHSNDWRDFNNWQENHRSTNFKNGEIYGIIGHSFLNPRWPDLNNFNRLCWAKRYYSWGHPWRQEDTDGDTCCSKQFKRSQWQADLDFKSTHSRWKFIKRSSSDFNWLWICIVCIIKSVKNDGGSLGGIGKKFTRSSRKLKS